LTRQLTALAVMYDIASHVLLRLTRLWAVF
jgi:hypothetical protein